MKRTPLARKTPLHAKNAPARTGRARKPPRDTGPTRKTRAIVLLRDSYRCVCCGRNVMGQPRDIQHRNSRGMGGTSDPIANSPVNLITMLRECHQRVESRIDPEDNAKGYWLRMGEDPALTGVMYFSEGGSGITMWLGADGSLSPDPPGEAVA